MPLGIVRKERAYLSNAVADRDDIVKRLVGELVEMFRSLLADINPHRHKDTHRIGMHFGRVAASAEDRDTAAAEVPQDALGHLRARTIVRTKEQYPRGMVRILGSRGVSEYWLSSALDESPRRPRNSAYANLEVEAIIYIAAVRGTATLGHKLLVTKLFEMVG